MKLPKLLVIVIFGVLCSDLTSSEKVRLVPKIDDNGAGTSLIPRNPDLITYLERAEAFIEAKKYQDAIIILKTVFEKFSNSLLPDENHTFLPLQNYLEEKMLTLPIEAQKIYFLEIDAQSKAIYEQGLSQNDIQKLASIHNQYNLSEYSDDASVYLGNYYFETGQFYLARSYFHKALEHPRKDISEDDVQLKLFFIEKLVQDDKQNSSKLFEQIKKSGYQLTLLNEINEENTIKKVFRSKKEDTVHAIEGIPKEGFKQSWVSLFGYETKPKEDGEVKNKRVNRNLFRGFNNNYRSSTDEKISDLSDAWKFNFWYFTSRPLFFDNEYLIKFDDEIHAININTNELSWVAMVDPKHDLKSKSRSESYYSYSSNERNRRLPSSYTEMLYFSDQVSSLMKLEDNILYTIGGHNKRGKAFENIRRGRVIVRNGRGEENVELGSFIYGIDVKSGKKVYKFGQDKDASAPLYNVSFLALPEKTLLGSIVVYSEKKGLYASLIDNRNKEVWKTFLCANQIQDNFVERQNAAVAVDENFAYFAFSNGLVFKVSITSGNFIWVKKYEGFQLDPNNYYGQTVLPIGAEKNVLIESNGKLVCHLMDQKQISVFDTFTGKLLFAYKENFFDKCRNYIAHDETGIIFSGEKGIVKLNYQMDLIWDCTIEDLVTIPYQDGNYLFAAIDKNIYCINSENGKKMILADMRLDSDGFVGNVGFHNGRFISLELDQATNYGNIKTLMELYNRQIAESGDSKSYEERGNIYLKHDDHIKAYADFKQAFERSSDADFKNKLIDKIYDLIINKRRDYEFVKIIFADMSKINFRENQKIVLNHLAMPTLVDKEDKDTLIETYLKSFTYTGEEVLVLNEKGNVEKNIWVDSIDKFNELMSTHKQAIISKVNSMNIDEENASRFIELYFSINDVDVKRTVLNKIYSRALYHNAPGLAFQFYELAKLQTAGEDFFPVILNQFNLLKKYGCIDEANVVALKIQKMYPEKLAENTKLFKFTTEFEKLKSDGLFTSGIRLITDPPLEQLYTTKKINSTARLSVVNIGLDERTDFLDNHLFLSDKNNGLLYCVDLFTGNEVWKLDMNQDGNKSDWIKNEGFYFRSHNIGIYNEVDHIGAIDLMNGKILWRKKISDSFICGLNEGVFVLSQEKEQLIGLSIFDGSVLWNKNISDSNVEKIFIGEGHVVMVFDSQNSFQVLKIKNGDMSFEEKSINGYINYPVYFNEGKMLYNDSGNLVYRELATGKTIWKTEENVNIHDYNNNYSGSFFHQNKFYFQNNQNGIKVSSVDLEKGSVEDVFKPSINNMQNFQIALCFDQKEIAVAMTSPYSNNKDVERFDFVYRINLENKKVVFEHKYLIDRNNLNQNNVFLNTYIGEVFPRLEKASNNRNYHVRFYRRKDGSLVEKCMIDKNYYVNSLFFKGPVLFVATYNEIETFGNKKLIDRHLELRKKLQEGTIEE